MLIEGEKVIMKASPHPVSFWPYYLFFTYYVAIGAVFLMEYDRIAEGLRNYIPFDQLILPIFLLLWLAAVIAPAVVFSVLMISWRWAILYTLIGFALIYLLITHRATIFDLQYAIVGTAFLGIVLTDIYRRSHEYIITNYRIITKAGFFGGVERQVFYSKITDVVIKRGLLGRIFNYGTVIPITASGLGTGEDVAALLVSIGGEKKLPVGGVGAGVSVLGTKGVRVPRGRSSLILYGVPKPEEVKKRIIERMAATESSQYLEKWEEMLKKLVK